MKTVLIACITLVLSLSFAAAADSARAQEHQGHGDQHKTHDMQSDADKEITLVGEVLDLYCYMKHPANGQGAEHAKCAMNCIKKGLPIGFLSDGEVYLIIGKEHESAKDIVVEFAGMQARLTGVLIAHDGIKSIEIHSIEKSDS